MTEKVDSGWKYRLPEEGDDVFPVMKYKWQKSVTASTKKTDPDGLVESDLRESHEG